MDSTRDGIAIQALPDDGVHEDMFGPISSITDNDDK
jgi:hypothetical protein